METLIVGEGEGFLDLREVAKTIEKSASFAQLLRKWRLFGEELNLKDDVIEDLQKRMDNGTYELSDLPRQILKRWKASQGTEATLQKLCEALEDCGVLHIADELKTKFGKTDSDEGPHFLLHDRVHTLKQLLGENAPKEIIQTTQEKYKSSRADKPIPLLKKEVSPKNIPDYYISRSFFSQTELHEQIFADDSTKEHIFVFTGAPKSELARASGFQMIESSGHQLDRITVRFIMLEGEDDFEKICAISSQPVHMITFNNGRFFWLKSSQGLDVIQLFLKTRVMNTIKRHELQDSSEDEEESDDSSSEYEDSLSENEESDDTSENGMDKFPDFCMFGEEEAVNRITSLQESSAVGIAESPGMGKTYVLNSLAENIGQKAPYSVVIFIVLQELVSQTYSINLRSSLDFILNYATEDHSKKSILKEMWNSNSFQFYLFFDGYDEVFQEKLELVDVILQSLLKTRNVKIIVTTRKHLNPRLEKLFNSLSFQMLPFNHSNQIKFLTKYWTTKHGATDGETLKEFAKKCLSKLQATMTDTERIIAGVPLQCMMLAEIYIDDAIRASKQQVLDGAIKEFSFFQMYKNLIDVKCSKIRDPLTRQRCIDQHVHSAITLLFPDWLEKFIPLLTPPDDIEENTLFSIGLIEKSPFSSAPRFVHRTFAEYIFADFICRHIYKNETCVEFLIQQILGKNGITEEKNYSAAFPIFRVKNEVIAYFLNTNLQERIVYTPDALISTNPQNVSAEDVCIAAYTCCCNNLESCFNVMADVISRFNITDKEELKDKYIKLLLYIAVKYSNSVSFVQRVLNFTKFVFGANLARHLGQESLSLGHGLFIGNGTPLHIAVREGKYNIVMHLLTEYGEEVLSFKHLLHACVYRSEWQSDSVIEEKLLIIEALTERNREWLEEERFSRTPLLENRVHVRIAKYLVTLGANINAHSTKYGTVLHTEGDRNSFTALVRFALRNGFHLVNFKDRFGETPLMSAIENYKTVDDEVLQLFYDAGADFNDQDNQGASILFYAIQYSDGPHFIEKILDFGANLNHVDKEGRNAAHFALFPRQSYDNVNKNVKLESLKLLKSRGFNRFNEKDYYGRTPIMASEKTRWMDFTFDDEVFNFLQKEGVDFNAQDKHGNSVLFCAIEFTENLHFIQKLLDFGANPNHRGENGRNAAHVVLECYKDTILAEKVLKLLKSRGFVGFNDKDLKGNTPLMLALNRNFSGNLLKFLRQETSECSGQKGNW